MIVSYLSKILGFKKHGEDLRKYVSLGIAKQFLNKYSAEWLSIFPRQPAISSRLSNFDSSFKLVKQIGKKIQDATGEKLSTFYLLQNISMAIQRGNAICVTTCVKDQSSGLEGLFNFQVHEAEEVYIYTKYFSY